MYVPVSYTHLSGLKASTLRVNGEDVDIKVEYAKDRYDTIDKLEGMMIPTASGTALPDVYKRQPVFIV